MPTYEGIALNVCLLFLIKGMANSDNVVRAGFTDKFKDTGTLRRIMISTMG